MTPIMSSTTRSRTLDHATGLLLLLALSMALLAPRAFAGPLMTVAFLTGGALKMAAVKSQRPATADFTRASPAERRRFLIENTLWLVLMLVSFGIVVFLIYSTRPPIIRTGLGIPILLAGALAHLMVARTAATHATRVVIPVVR